MSGRKLFACVSAAFVVVTATAAATAASTVFGLTAPLARTAASAPSVQSMIVGYGGAIDVNEPVHIIPSDSDVDTLNKQLHRELSSFMVESPANISRCLSLMAISRSLERVADHATNIAEEVVYLYEARDIRHSKAKPNEAQNPGR